MGFPFGVAGGIGSLGWWWCGGSGGGGGGGCSVRVPGGGLGLGRVCFGLVRVPVAWVGRRGLYVSH